MREPICTEKTASLLRQAAFRYVSISDALYEDGQRDLAQAVAKAARLLADAGCTLEERLAAQANRGGA